MTPELKAAWIKALRGRGYRQTTQVLQDGSRNYCCLGVLCRVAEKIEGFKPRCDTDGELRGSELENQKNLFGLSISIRNKLMTMNDEDKASFNKIADYIETNVKAT